MAAKQSSLLANIFAFIKESITPGFDRGSLNKVIS
jgi:hypothetical protein